MSLKVIQFPALEDNYNFLLIDPETGTSVTVDPSGCAPVGPYLEDKGISLHFIWNTHHHFDHVGGNRELKAKFGAKIIGPAYDRQRIPEIDQTVREGDRVSLGALAARVLFVPGHTHGHIAYWFENDNALFIGDTLFAMGCGRLFEGTPEQMWQSLNKLLTLPDATRVYCAHEYTLANARFASTVEPNNTALRNRLKDVIQRRQEGQPTVPTTIGLEKQTNPFLRPNSPEIRERLGLKSAPDVEVFARLREMKDGFRGTPNL